METNPSATSPVVEAEETVYSSRYSNNGASPMWCFNSTCIVRQGDEVFVSGYERIPGAPPMNDCRWALWQRTADGWVRRQADETGRQREPCPLGRLPGGRILLSSNPTLLPTSAAGGGPARPELLVFDRAAPTPPPIVLHPVWQGSPPFSQHSYRTLAVDAATGEAILLQNANYTHSEWALRRADGTWSSGQLAWPAHAPTDMAPFGASHARVNYPVVAMKDRAVHFCGQAAYDNWDRVKTPADLGLGSDPNAPGASGMAARQRGNRFRRLLYTWTAKIGEQPFSDWLEIDNTFADGGWLFATDLHVDANGTVHLLWFRSPMLPTVRDKCYPDIQRVYSIRYATLRDGKVLSRRTLVAAGEGAGPAIPTDLDQVGRPYVLDNGETILGDAIPTHRFHATPDGGLFLVYYVSDGGGLSENRLLAITPDATPSKPVVIPLRHPLTQFFTASPRAGGTPSWTLDLLGHRRGGWRTAEGADGREWEGVVSYARVRLDAGGDHAVERGLPSGWGDARLKP
ncbi:MAG: hypothetical protein BWZ02_01046 [Lentisphaerae bacterium ADurb.BinA184]|nr:MAG: hypothetical protein BWZ02_01046 [Lentisphaerae bacterium ADurb.BinA184]